MVEFDVQRTLDGHLIVVHDATFARTTDVAHESPGRQDDPVGSFTWAEVRQLDAGSWFAPGFAATRIPSLRQVLPTVRPTHLRLQLELKNPAAYPGVETQVAQRLARSGYTASHRVWVHSFDAAALERFHDAAPSIPVGLISETGSVSATDANWLTTLNATSESTTDARVDAAAHLGLRVLAWPSSGTADTSDRVEQLVDDGVVGIITDDPAQTRQDLTATVGEMARVEPPGAAQQASSTPRAFGPAVRR